MLSNDKFEEQESHSAAAKRGNLGKEERKQMSSKLGKSAEHCSEKMLGAACPAVM